MSDDAPLEEFIADTFVSVWTLELLALLIDAAPGGLLPDELVEHLRASEVVVSQGVHALIGAGIAQIGEDGRIGYRPLSHVIDDCSRRAVDFYRKFPGRTRRIIVTSSAPGLTAFADAFRIRKD